MADSPSTDVYERVRDSLQIESRGYGYFAGRPAELRDLHKANVVLSNLTEKEMRELLDSQRTRYPEDFVSLIIDRIRNTYNYGLDRSLFNILDAMSADEAYVPILRKAVKLLRPIGNKKFDARLESLKHALEISKATILDVAEAKLAELSALDTKDLLGKHYFPVFDIINDCENSNVRRRTVQLLRRIAYAEADVQHIASFFREFTPKACPGCLLFFFCHLLDQNTAHDIWLTLARLVQLKAPENPQAVVEFVCLLEDAASEHTDREDRFRSAREWTQRGEVAGEEMPDTRRKQHRSNFYASLSETDLAQLGCEHLRHVADRVHRCVQREMEERIRHSCGNASSRPAVCIPLGLGSPFHTAVNAAGAKIALWQKADKE